VAGSGKIQGFAWVQTDLPAEAAFSFKFGKNSSL
jgi:hypothetical protein